MREIRFMLLKTRFLSNNSMSINSHTEIRRRNPHTEKVGEIRETQKEEQSSTIQ